MYEVGSEHTYTLFLGDGATSITMSACPAGLLAVRVDCVRLSRQKSELSLAFQCPMRKDLEIEPTYTGA